MTNIREDRRQTAVSKELPNPSHITETLDPVMKKGHWHTSNSHKPSAPVFFIEEESETEPKPKEQLHQNVHMKGRKQKECSKQDAEHPNYFEDKLLRAGDIETEPGPKTNYQATGTNHVHLLIIITLFTLLLNKLQQYSGEAANDSQKYLTEGLLSSANLLRLKTRHFYRNIPAINTSSATITILLLMAGDIHPNPGQGGSQHCATTGCGIKEPTSLICETCRNSYHLKCITNLSDQRDTNLLEQSFDWICPNLECLPNHHQRDNPEVHSSTNRYNILDKAVSDASQEVKHRKKVQKHKKTTVKMKSKGTNLLNELPKITSKDYIGKELCTGCCKEIKERQQAISCDQCERWIHRTCSDMSIQHYKKNSKKQNFIWVCTKCRHDEILIDDKLELRNFDQANTPDSFSTVQKTKKELLIVHMNCRSVNNKNEELENIIQSLDPDILCLTETWMDDSVPSQANLPEGYCRIRKDRSASFKQKYGKNKGGGVAILYKKHLKVEEKTYLTDKTEEILWVHVKVKESFMLGVIYRAEYTELLNEDEEETKIEENIRKACEISNNLIVTGDFNIDTLDEDNKNTQILNNIYGSYGLTQHINKATRIDKNTLKPTTIDHIWSSEESQLIKSSGTFIGLSDHLGLYMKLNRSKPVPPKTTLKFRDYRNYKAEALCTQLQANIDDSEIQNHLENNDVNSATDVLMKIIQTTVDIHAPLVEKNSKQKLKYIPWFTKELKEMITSKNELLQDYFSQGLQAYKTRIKILGNKITVLKRTLKQKYITKKLEEANGDGKKYWKVINSITGRQKSREDKEPDMMTQDKADTFNKYFATVGLEIQKKIGVRPAKKEPLMKANMPNFKFKEEKQGDIEKIIDKIRLEVATGSDNIGAKIIKDIKTTISPILTKIINKGYETSTFPDCMKQAVIKPIHKKDNIDDISNYRPISILPTLSKVFERLAVNQLTKYLETNKLLCRNQHAYRQSHSTVTCLVELLNYIYQLLDKKSYTAIVSLDLSKAFDSINHQLILRKLSTFGLEKSSISWIESYLKNRRQTTKFRNYTSKEEIVSSGIPQGSILGPLLFLVFTNDLAEIYREETMMVAYADDNQLVVTAKNMLLLKSKIEKVIKTAQTWYLDNTMKNNLGKTEILVFNHGKTTQNLKITIEDEGKKTIIKSKPFIKVLGVIIDSKLNWTNQVNSVKHNAMNITRNIHRINHLLPLKVRTDLYKTVISPQFSYADIVWGGCTKQDSKSLQRIQNFAVKSITGHRKYDSATYSLNKLKLLNLEKRRQIHETVFTHKALKEKNTDNINQQYKDLLSAANTRQATTRKLTVPIHKTSKFESSPLYRTIKSWNNCPPNLPFDNIKTHKNMLQTHLLNNPH